MARRPFHKLLATIAPRRRRPRVTVVVQTERGQVTVPADVLRERLRNR